MERALGEITADTEAVKEAWDKSEEAASNGNVLGAITNTGATDWLNTYIAGNCGPEYAPAGYGATGNQGSTGVSAWVNKARVGAYQLGQGAN